MSRVDLHARSVHTHFSARTHRFFHQPTFHCVCVHACVLGGGSPFEVYMCLYMCSVDKCFHQLACQCLCVFSYWGRASVFSMCVCVCVCVCVLQMTFLNSSLFSACVRMGVGGRAAVFCTCVFVCVCVCVHCR